MENALPPDADSETQRRAEVRAAEVRADSARNPRLRIASGVAGTVLLLAALRADVAWRQGWFLLALMTLCCLQSLREFHGLVRYRGVKPFAWIAYAAAPLYLIALECGLLYGPGAWRVGGSAGLDAPGIVLLAFAVASCVAVVLRRQVEGALVDLAATWLGFGYVVCFASCFLRIRHLSLSNPWGLDWAAVGMELVFLTVFVTKMTDIGALLVGKRLGRHKMIPRLSPGKTWEGAVGGLVSGMAFMALVVCLEPGSAVGSLGLPVALGLAFLLGVSGMFGDLVESAFKRDSAAKDAGASIPGFGGVLDLIDSLLLAGPVMYAALLACGAES